MPKSDLCIECGKHPAAFLGNWLCIYCIHELEAADRITRGMQLIEEGKQLINDSTRDLARLRAERAKAEQAHPPQEEDHAPP